MTLEEVNTSINILYHYCFIFKGVSSEPQQALHGNSILTEEEDSPTFKVCDNKGKISEQQTFKMRLEKPKANSSNGMSFENGAYKMDNLGQYFNTFIKVQVLALNHQCKVIGVLF